MLRLQALNGSGIGDNVTFIAYILIIATLLSTSWRLFYLDARDPYKCEALATRGTWLNKPLANGTRLPYTQWQAPGCLMHQYKPEDIVTCAGGRRMVFAGDSTVRQVYHAMARKLGETPEEEELAESTKHVDGTFTREGVMLEFIWDPYLNKTATLQYLEAYSGVKSGNSSAGDSPALMLLGTGAWFSRWFDLAPSLKHFKESIDQVTKYTAFEQTLSQTLSASPEVGDQVFFQPIQIPLYDKLKKDRKKTVIKGEVETMNLYLEDVSLTNNVLWSYLELTGDSLLDTLDPSGFHVISSIADVKADILLNLRCNAKLDKSDGYPMDRTCCSNYRPAVWVQWVLLIAAVIVGGFGIRSAMTETQSSELDALVFFAGTLLYCYLADRTQLFDHGKKYYNNTEFFLLSGITFVAGVLTIRRSGRPNASGVIPDQPFLSRDQTEEWKGWMQFLILIYHWTGASSVLWIYEIIRLMVASYLFLTGFGHTCFFLKKGDFGFKRVAGVLVRLNLLSCALPYVMGTDYLFYYFAPLVTFWFGIVWVTMRVYASRNASTLFVLGKIVLAAGFVTILLELPAFDFLFGALKLLCRIDWDVVEWKFRLGLDRYIVFVGMLVALLYERHGDFVSAEKLGYLRIAAIITSIIALPAVQTVYRTFDTKQGSNSIQPYLAAVPILAFVVLRNAAPGVRNFHSTFFAWLGKCSLETFTLQFHIWLAADTKGLLTLGIFEADGSLLKDRWRDFLVLTPLFFWVSWKLAAATGVMTAFILREDKGQGDETEEALLEKGMVTSARNFWSKLKPFVWPGDIRLRLAAILAGMWFLNVTW